MVFLIYFSSQNKRNNFSGLYFLNTILVTSYLYSKYIIDHFTYPQISRPSCPTTHEENCQNLQCTDGVLKRKSFLLTISPLFYIPFAISSDG